MTDALSKIPHEPVRKALPIRESNWWGDNKIWVISLSTITIIIILLSIASAGTWVRESVKDMNCIELNKQINIPHNHGWLENYAEYIMQDEYDGRCK